MWLIQRHYIFYFALSLPRSNINQMALVSEFPSWLVALWWRSHNSYRQYDEMKLVLRYSPMSSRKNSLLLVSLPLQNRSLFAYFVSVVDGWNPCLEHPQTLYYLKRQVNYPKSLRCLCWLLTDLSYVISSYSPLPQITAFFLSLMWFLLLFETY